MPFETSRSQRFRNKLQAFMSLVESTPTLSNFVKLEPNLKFASYMAPKGLQYCDILLRVPLSAAEVQNTSSKDDGGVSLEVSEIFANKLRQVLNSIEQAKEMQKKPQNHGRGSGKVENSQFTFEETKEQNGVNSPQSPSNLDI